METHEDPEARVVFPGEAQSKDLNSLSLHPPLPPSIPPPPQVFVYVCPLVSVFILRLV